MHGNICKEQDKNNCQNNSINEDNDGTKDYFELDDDLDLENFDESKEY